MAAEGSTWSDDQKDEIIRIAESAIETITQLSNVVGRSNGARAPATAPSNSGSSRSENAVDELHRRFPTAGSRFNSRGSRSRSARPAPYPSRRPAGRPRESLIVSKDVIVIEYEHDRVPSKTEKIELEKSKRVISGFEVNREWTAKQLEKELEALLKGTQMEGFCFEIMKNCSGTLVTPNVPSGRKIDSKLLLKSIAPTGCIYIRLLAELDDESDEMLEHSVFSIPENQAEASFTATTSTSSFTTTLSSSSSSTMTLPSSSSRSSSTVSSSIITPSSTNTTVATVDLTVATSHNSAGTSEESVDLLNATASNREEHPIQCPFDINAIISDAKSKNLTDPVELLRFLQERIVKGRQLDLTSLEETCDGETTFITVDRDKVLETTLSELEFVDDYTLTFKVDFMGEVSVDLGGPRKEWIRLVNREMKAKYFDNGLREYLSQDYYYVGIMIAVAMLQNGQMPAFIDDHILQEILSRNRSLDPCVNEMKAGLEKLGMLSALQQLPTLINLLRPGSQHKVNVPRLLQMLKPKFSEEGSNAIGYEKEVYMLFVRYVREVASGRRSCGSRKLELCHILEFVTGASEEPVLGFAMNPYIEFDIPVITRVQKFHPPGGKCPSFS